MRFPYRAFPASSPTKRVRVRPIIEARVIGLSRSVAVYGLLDTGAEATMLDTSFIDILDVHIKPGDHEIFRNADGTLFLVSFGIIDIEITSRNRKQVYRWHARVGFMEREQGAIFGYEGFLQYFCASFHGPKGYVNLVPRMKLPVPCMPGGST